MVWRPKEDPNPPLANGPPLCRTCSLTHCAHYGKGRTASFMCSLLHWPSYQAAFAGVPVQEGFASEHGRKVLGHPDGQVARALWAPEHVIVQALHTSPCPAEPRKVAKWQIPKAPLEHLLDGGRVSRKGDSHFQTFCFSKRKRLCPVGKT